MRHTISIRRSDESVPRRRLWSAALGSQARPTKVGAAERSPPTVSVKLSAPKFVIPIQIAHHRSQSSRTTKLLQEPDVIFVQQPDVIQPVFQRAQPIQSQSEREAGELFGIDRDGVQHVRVDHSRPAHLDPAGAFANTTAPASALE